MHLPVGTIKMAVKMENSHLPHCEEAKGGVRETCFCSVAHHLCQLSTVAGIFPFGGIGDAFTIRLHIIWLTSALTALLSSCISFRREEGVVEARSVDAALQALTLEKQEVDRHPEK